MVTGIEKPRDLSSILKPEHVNKWVAINPSYSRVFASADTLAELIKAADDADAIYYRVLPRDVTFAPAILKG